jgi:hypothetical protein
MLTLSFSPLADSCILREVERPRRYVQAAGCTGREVRLARRRHLWVTGVVYHREPRIAPQTVHGQICPGDRITIVRRLFGRPALPADQGW